MIHEIMRSVAIIGLGDIYEYYGGAVVLIYFIIVLLIGIGLAIFAGLLWNYYVIKELKAIKSKLEDMTDVIGYGLDKVAKSSNASGQTAPHYQMKRNDEPDMPGRNDEKY